MNVMKTFCMIKPDAVSNGYTGAIIARLEAAGFEVCALQMVRLHKDTAAGFYAEHRERPFFDELVSFMSSGPVVMIALERDDAVSHLRELIGSTDPSKAALGSIRNLYGTAGPRNAIHGSDSAESAERELGLFFR